jgi:hypothetical protein
MKTEFILVPSMFGMISFVVWVIVNGWERRQHWKHLTDFNSRLLDRLGSVKDFTELLKTDEGGRFLGLLTAQRQSVGAPDRILRAAQTGVVSIVLGLGFLFLGWRFVFDDHEAFSVVGVVALSLGAGLLLSAGVSYWVARRLGLLENATPSRV